jgi:hypothetical protein
MEELGWLAEIIEYFREKSKNNLLIKLFLSVILILIVLLSVLVLIAVISNLSF